MPLYEFRCDRCDHRPGPPRFAFTRGLSLAQFDLENGQGWARIKCPRCKRAGRCRTNHLAGGKAKSFYTFGENAPDPLVGRTVDEGTKKRLLKQYGLAEAGNHKARTTPGVQTFTAADVTARWAKRAEEEAARAEKSATEPKPLDIVPDTPATLAPPKVVAEPKGSRVVPSENWNTLKRQAKRLNLRVRRNYGKPELTQLVQAALDKKAARSVNP
jgi:hypothetical protein